jgi:hypothetical protein
VLFVGVVRFFVCGLLCSCVLVFVFVCLLMLLFVFGLLSFCVDLYAHTRYVTTSSITEGTVTHQSARGPNLSHARCRLRR